MKFDDADMLMRWIESAALTLGATLMTTAVVIWLVVFVPEILQLFRQLLT